MSMKNSLKILKRISEHTSQTVFFIWLSNYPKIREASFHIPNGGFRNAREAKNLQRSGVLSGVPDVFIAIPKGGFHGLFIEFKAGKNKLTQNQERMIPILLSHGYQVKVCYSWEDGMHAVEEYFENQLR